MRFDKTKNLRKNRPNKSGNCDFDTSNDCVQDCAGQWGGTAYYDDCGLCNGGNAAQDGLGVCSRRVNINADMVAF